MSPVSALVIAFILSGLTATRAQTRMEQLFQGHSYFASDTLHTRNETRPLCARWNMSDQINLLQTGHLLFLCNGNAPILPSFRARYWMITPTATASQASTINLVIPCAWTENVPGDLMLRVMCFISQQTDYTGTVPPPEEPPPGSATLSPQDSTPPSEGDTTPPPVGPQTELPPTCGSILFQIPTKTQFLYMILVLAIPLLNAYSQTIDASESPPLASAAAVL